MLKWILGFLLGISSIFWLAEPISFKAWVSTIALLLVLFSISGRIYDKSRFLHATAQLVIGACCGLLWQNLHCEWRLSDRITQPIPETHIIKAKLVSMPQIYNDLLQFTVKVRSSGNQQLDGKKLKLSWYQYSQELANDKEYPKLGEAWQFTVKVKPQVTALNLEGYDVEKQSFINNIAGKGTISSYSSTRLSKASSYSIDALRQTLFERLAPFDNAGIFQALLIGEKSNIKPEQRLQIQALGISHLLAISGLHIGIIAGLSFWLTLKLVSVTNRFGFLISPLLVAAIISLFAAVFYSALAGFSIATVRALIMWAAFVFSLVFASQQLLLRSLVLALLAILIFDPISILSYGFWLTFIAIVIIGSVLFGRVISTENWSEKIWLGIKVQWAISLGMMLAVFVIFQQVSFIAFFVNIILIPLFSVFVLPLIFISVVLLLVINVSFGLELIDIAFSHFFNWISLDELMDTGLFLKAYLDEVSFLILMVAYLIYLLPIGRVRFYPVIFCFVFAFMSFSQDKKDSDYKLVVFDIGHGLANLVYNSDFALLYDTAFANQGFSYAETTIIPTLRKLGVKNLDLIIVSHNDLDHSGGLDAIKSSVPALRIIHSDTCQSVKYLELDELKLAFYSPFNNKKVKSNNQSCVMKVSTENKSVLLTGDIEKDAEISLIKQVDSLKSDILISPHHGSNTSSLYPFIKSVDAELVIHSTDRFNRWGFPKSNVKERYNEMGYKQLSTGCSGMIEVNLNSGAIKKMRQQRRIWRLQECRI